MESKYTKPDDVPDNIWDKMPEDEREVYLKYHNNQEMDIHDIIVTMQARAAKAQALIEEQVPGVDLMRLGTSGVAVCVTASRISEMVLMPLLSCLVKAAYHVGYEDGIRIEKANKEAQ